MIAVVVAALPRQNTTCGTTHEAPPQWNPSGTVGGGARAAWSQITLQFANAYHESYGKEFAKTITVNVNGA